MKTVLAVVFVLNFGFNLVAQINIERSVIGNTGNATVTSDFIVSYTIGEAIGNTIEGEQYLLSQGFEQGRQDTVWVGFLNNELNIEIKVFPNPTMNGLNIQFIGNNQNHLHIEAFDATGKLMLQMGQLTGNDYLDLSGFASGAYFIKIMNEQNDQFKIVKVEKLK